MNIDETIGNFQYILCIRQYYYHSVIFLGILELFYFLRQWYFKNLRKCPFFFGEQWQNVWEDVSCSLYLAFKWFQKSIYTHMFYTCRLASSIQKKKKRSNTCVKMLVLKIGKQRHRCLLCSCFTFFAGLKFLKIQILEKI